MILEINALRDMILGGGALIITIVIVMTLRLMGVIKEEREKGTRLTNKQIITNVVGIIILTSMLVWALSRT